MKKIILLALLFLTSNLQAQQVIDQNWLTANATAFGGDPNNGPWVLGVPFPGFPLPAPDNNLYPYKLSMDINAEGSGFISSKAIQLDLSGHKITFDNSTPIEGLNGEFESDIEGSNPSGWTLSDPINTLVYSPTSHGEPVNRLFGKNILSCKLSASIKATASLDINNQIVLTFTDPAPVIDNQIYSIGFIFTGSKYIDGFNYVVGNPTPNTILISRTKNGAPLTATTINKSISKVGLVKSIRTTNPIKINKADGKTIYAFKHAMTAIDYGLWGGGFAVGCAGRIIDAETNLEIASDNIQSGGYRPFCYPTIFTPSKPISVYLEIDMASSVGALSIGVDAIRLTRAFNNGIIASQQYFTNFPGILQLPTKMLSGTSSYMNGRAFSLIGNGSIIQGPGKSYSGCCFQAQACGYPISIIGDPINMTVNGDNASFICANSYAANINGGTRTLSNIECTYDNDVDVVNRMYGPAGINLITSTGNISLSKVNGYNVPQYWVALDQFNSKYTVNIDSCNAVGNAKVSNGYLWMFNNTTKNLTMTNCKTTGSGYGIALYPAVGSSTLKDSYENIKILNCTFDLFAQPEREYGYYNSHRVIKLKTVSPGPFKGFKDILFQNCKFIARSSNGIVNLVYGGQFDVRNGNNIGGNGNIRFIQCLFEALTDDIPPITGGSIFTSGFSFDQCDPGNFPIFYGCTFSGESCGIRLSGADGNECHGSVALNCRFNYNGTNIDKNAYQILWIGNPTSSNSVSNFYLIDPIIDQSLPYLNSGTHWSGFNGLMSTQFWNFRLLNPGAGYTNKPTFTAPPNMGTGVVVSMGPDTLGNSNGAVSIIAQNNYGSSIPGHINYPQQLVTFSNTPNVIPAVAEIAMIGNEWPYRSYKYGHGLKITVIEDTLLPVKDALVTIFDVNKNQVFPNIPGSLNIDNTTLVPTMTDSNGHIGLTTDIPIIPLPSTLITQGDSVTKSTSSGILGTTSLDGSITSKLTKGTVTTNSLSPYTIIISKPGYETYTKQIDANNVRGLQFYVKLKKAS